MDQIALFSCSLSHLLLVELLNNLHEANLLLLLPERADQVAGSSGVQLQRESG